MSSFRVNFTPQQSEVDFNGNVNDAVYFSWADRARVEFLRRAGIGRETFIAHRMGPIILEARACYLRGLRVEDDVEVTCELDYDRGKTITIRHRFIRDHKEVVAELIKVIGVIDSTTGRLVADPDRVLRSLAIEPDLLELRSSRATRPVEGVVRDNEGAPGLPCHLPETVAAEERR